MNPLVDLGATLAANAEDAVATRARRAIRPLRGIRGVPLAVVARTADTIWKRGISLPRDADALDAAFGTAFEDGLVAIALAAAALPDSPVVASALGLAWAHRTDDPTTADALGSILLGGSVALAGGVSRLDALRQGSVWCRRSRWMAAMGRLPVPLEGPAVAGLRARLGTPNVQWVDAPQRADVAALLDDAVKATDPPLHKALRRILTTWSATDEEGCRAWAQPRWSQLPPVVRNALTR